MVLMQGWIKKRSEWCLRKNDTYRLKNDLNFYFNKKNTSGSDCLSFFIVNLSVSEEFYNI